MLTFLRNSLRYNVQFYIRLMEANNVFYQYDFRQKHSTQQSIITLVDRITISLNDDGTIISVFLDLKKDT